jgi:hypothetical protein
MSMFDKTGMFHDGTADSAGGFPPHGQGAAAPRAADGDRHVLHCSTLQPPQLEMMTPSERT